MEENWYAIEQQIRDRITEARTAARIRALTQTLASRHANGLSEGLIVPPMQCHGG